MLKENVDGFDADGFDLKGSADGFDFKGNADGFYLRDLKSL